MSYCRFQNTVGDLEDCYENIFDKLEGEEFEARKRLIDYCKMIVDEAGETEFEEESEDDDDEDDEEEVEDENGMTQSKKETYQEQRAEANE